MTEEERSKIKEMIANRIIKVEKKVANYEEMTQPIKPENSIGRLSRLDAINNKSVVEAALRRAKENLNALKAAVDNIEEEEFGLCKGCGDAIPMGRIVLKPENPYCVSCAI
jgi:DnaK suppressor protein